MNTKHYSESRKQKLMGLAVTGIMAAIPLVGTAVVSQAAPTRYAQVVVVRGRHSRTYHGIVTQNFGGSQFSLALRRGRSLRVDASRIATGRFHRGDHVTVTGHYNADQSLFIARTITVD